MKKNVLPLIILFLFFSLSCFSQKKNLTPGYYITLNNDSIHGYISIEKEKPVTSFAFRKTPGERNPAIIPADSCISFSTGTDLYTTMNVSRNMTHIDKFSYDITWPDSNITEPIPLKLLYAGNLLSLYHYKDVKDHFFMDDGKTVQELVIQYRYLTDADKMKLKMYNIPRYFIDKDYIRQIGAALNYQITERQWYLIQTIEFEEKPLTKLFKNLNGGKR